MLTYGFSFTDNSKQGDNIGMSELCHDGRFLEEFYLIYFARSLLEKLHSNLNVSSSISPHTSLNKTKLP